MKLRNPRIIEVMANSVGVLSHPNPVIPLSTLRGHGLTISDVKEMDIPSTWIKQGRLASGTPFTKYIYIEFDNE